jgi:hypothetical protein
MQRETLISQNEFAYLLAGHEGNSVHNVLASQPLHWYWRGAHPSSGTYSSPEGLVSEKGHCECWPPCFQTGCHRPWRDPTCSCPAAKMLKTMKGIAAQRPLASSQHVILLKCKMARSCLLFQHYLPTETETHPASTRNLGGCNKWHCSLQQIPSYHGAKQTLSQYSTPSHNLSTLLLAAGQMLRTSQRHLCLNAACHSERPLTAPSPC